MMGEVTRHRPAVDRLVEAHEPQLRLLATRIAASPHNLVSRRARDELWEVHIREAVAVAEVLAPSVRPGSHWIDLGTGGGLPGLVLALLAPGATWGLIDAREKKIEEVARFAAELGLLHVKPCAGRAERLARQAVWRGAADGLVARALAPLPVLVELARGFVAEGGEVVAIKGPGLETELEQASEACRATNLKVSHIDVIEGLSREVRLARLRAVGPIPDWVPRRDGVPSARPL